MNKILFSPIKEVSKKIRQGEIHPSEIVKASQKLIETIRPLNAYISITSNSANQESGENDEKVENRENPSDLYGIPIAIKDNFCTEGHLTTCGSLMLANFVPGYDATVCSRLKKSGAVLMGKTNLDQFAMGSGTVDSFFGPTKNIWGSQFMDYYFSEHREIPKGKGSIDEGDWYIAVKFGVIVVFFVSRSNFDSILSSLSKIIRILYRTTDSIAYIFSNNYFSIHSNPLSIILNLFLSLFQYKFTTIFSNTYFSIPYNPSSILLNIFLSLSQLQYTSIFFNLLFSISFYSTSMNVIFFYFFVNLNSPLSSSISPFLSHPILHLSTSIFLYLLANQVDVYLSLLQILNSLFISHYLSLQQKKISPLLRYFIFFFYKDDYILWPMK